MNNLEQNSDNNWKLFLGNGQKNTTAITSLEKINNNPPPWRKFGDLKDVFLEKNDKEEEIELRWQRIQSLGTKNTRDQDRAMNFRISPDGKSVIDAVNAAIYLRRPLLVTGNPGAGKTSLAYAIARLQDTNFDKNNTPQDNSDKSQKTDD